MSLTERVAEVRARPLPVVDRILGQPLWLLLPLSLLMVIAGSRELTVDNDWQFFSWGSGLLFGEHHSFVRSSYSVDPSLPGGLHTYASYPFLQIGPPPLLLARLLSVGPQNGALVAAVVVQGLCLVALGTVGQAFPARSREQRLGHLLAAALVVVVWGQLTHFHHLDDALAITSACAAVLALQRERPVVAGLLLGLASASKPWAVVVLPLALVLTGARPRATCLSSALVVILASWGPFVVVDSGTLELGRISLSSVPGGPLGVLGVDVVTHSTSLRLAQLVLGTALATYLVATRRWGLALVGAFALRLAVDPATYGYYASGVVVAGYVADRWAGRSFPLMTLIAAAGWAAAASVGPRGGAVVRLVEYAALLAACLLVHGRSRPGAPQGRQPATSAAAPS